MDQNVDSVNVNLDDLVSSEDSPEEAVISTFDPTGDDDKQLSEYKDFYTEREKSTSGDDTSVVLGGDISYVGFFDNRGIGFYIILVLVLFAILYYIKNRFFPKLGCNATCASTY